MSDTPRPPANPFVGPRAFVYGEQLYGRDQELVEILDLLIAERIILLYAPSGAGKTSLIQAALIPRLREEGFHVFPPARLGLKPPIAPDDSQAQDLPSPRTATSSACCSPSRRTSRPRTSSPSPI